MTAPATQVLSRTAIVVGATAADREAAIDQVGALLVAGGFVTPDYVAAMRAREAIMSTYLGNGISLPHGTNEAQAAIVGTGLAVVQYPGGVPWGDEKARLVIGLAARSEEHIGILSRLASVLEDETLCTRLAETADADEIYRALTVEAEPPRPRIARIADDQITRTIRIANPSGLHARPAAEIVEKVLDFDAEVAISTGERQANAISITQVIALGASKGDEVTVSASGSEAAAAMEAVLTVLLAESDGAAP
ncbi:MAG TPA: HPr family phosphocarrier protein [Candidatus Limnocylindrales bacterium]|jgi:phosphocarrier protein FPr